jgi:SAM-dependent methyltransferase
VIEGQRDIRRAYQDETVASRYVEERFVHPLGALLHRQQRDALRRLVADVQPRTVLEIAPGPARLTRELALTFEGRGTVVDTSAEMLSVARQHVVSDRWRFVQGDAFCLPFGRRFDLVYSFRLIRHFDASDRSRLYEQIRQVLAIGGWLMFDAVNREVSERVRAQAPGDHVHFDALLDERELREELAASGFSAVRLDAVHRRYSLLQSVQIYLGPRSPQLARLALDAIDRVPGGRPLEWIVTCRRDA